MSDRPFSHPNFGTEVRVQQVLNEVHVIFVAKTDDQASSLFDTVSRQLQDGGLHITMMGKPTEVVKQ